MVPRTVRERFALHWKNEKAKCVGFHTRCVLYPTHSIASTKVDRWAKAWGSYNIEEDERVEQTVEDASVHGLRKVVSTSERSTDAHE